MLHHWSLWDVPWAIEYRPLCRRWTKLRENNIPEGQIQQSWSRVVLQYWRRWRKSKLQEGRGKHRLLGLKFVFRGYSRLDTWKADRKNQQALENMEKAAQMKSADSAAHAWRDGRLSSTHLLINLGDVALSFVLEGRHIELIYVVTSECSSL